MSLTNRYVKNKQGHISKIVKYNRSGIVVLENDPLLKDIHLDNNHTSMKNGYILMPIGFNPNKKHYEIYY